MSWSVRRGRVAVGAAALPPPVGLCTSRPTPGRHFHDVRDRKLARRDPVRGEEVRRVGIFAQV